MNRAEILEKAKRIITEEINKAGFNVEEIFLFGSRARGDESNQSDWDFYVVVDKEITRKKKQELIVSILRNLIDNKISADVLIQSKAKIERIKGFVGSIFYEVNKEGIKL